MRKLFKIILIFHLFGSNAIAQNNETTLNQTQLKIEISDVVERNPLLDLELIISSEKDTINIQVDSTSNLLFDLKFLGHYQVTVIKEGYDTLTFDWNQPSDSSELILEFYLPRTRTSLTRKDKRKAYTYSRDLPERPCDHCGGFQRIGVARNEMCVMRFRSFNNDQSLHRSYEFRKLKYY